MKNVLSINKLLSIILLVLLTACSGSGGDGSNAIIIDPDPVGGGGDGSSDNSNSLSGNYRGLWNSTTPSVTFTDFPVSAKFVVNADNTIINAEFFANSSLSANTTSGNHGTMVIRLDGKTITSFNFNDTIPGCTGSFSGSGTINSFGVFIINFTGNDCDGNHVGVLTFEKI